MKYPTPSTSHIGSSTNFEVLGIYEPAEDSFLLMDVMSNDAERKFLRERTTTTTGRSSALLVAEIGSGSGVIIAFLTANAKEIFGREDVVTLAVDVNRNAAGVVGRTVGGAVGERRGMDESEGNGRTTAMFTDTVLSDLTTSLRKGSVDVLVFNPPYVPTETLPDIPDDTTWNRKSKFERESHLLALAYAGGEDGMETTNRLLRELGEVLSQRGVAYVLLCKRNRPQEVLERLRGGGNGRFWKAEVVGESGGKGGWERLCVVRIWNGEG